MPKSARKSTPEIKLPTPAGTAGPDVTHARTTTDARPSSSAPHTPNAHSTPNSSTPSAAHPTGTVDHDATKPDSPRPDATKPDSPKPRHRLTRGARNLIILGVGSTLIAILTTTLGLAIYHLSGDIYLDRSRPGYLPDETEVEQETESKPETYDFEASGTLNASTLDDYLQHFSAELNAIDDYKDPFAEAPLSDERLGIPAE